MARKGHKVRPLGPRVLLQPLKAKGEQGGILLPEDAEADQLHAEVIAVGTDTDEEKILVKKGDLVLLHGFAGKKLKLEGEEYLIVENSEILAVLE